MNGLNAFPAAFVWLFGVVCLAGWSPLEYEGHFIKGKLLTWTIDHRLKSLEWSNQLWNNFESSIVAWLPTLNAFFK